MAVRLRLDRGSAGLCHRRRGIQFEIAVQDGRSFQTIIQCLFGHIWCNDAIHACKPIFLGRTFWLTVRTQQLGT
jgi:hypothetical protein